MNLSSANALNLDRTKMLLSGKELNSLPVKAVNIDKTKSFFMVKTSFPSRRQYLIIEWNDLHWAAEKLPIATQCSQVLYMLLTNHCRLSTMSTV